MTYSYAGFSGLWVRKPNGYHALWLLIIKDDIRDFSHFGALLANVFFDVKNGSRILLTPEQ